jgi:beta-phosphoglucomutase
MHVEAVIFDMDGVLVDSMPYHVRAWQKAFKPLGVDIPAAEVYAREGENWRKSTKDFLLMGGYKPSRKLVESVFRKRSRIFNHIFRPKLFSGAKGLARFLYKNGYRLALVTATPKNDVKKMLPVDILNLFSVRVCGNDTRKGKPDPQPYLKALRLLKLGPKQALVIENAPYGISSSKSAGIKCIALTTSLPKKYLKKADKVTGCLDDIKVYFKKEIKK